MNFDYAEFKNRPFGRGGSYRYRKIGGRERKPPLRHRIVAAAAPRMAARQPFQGEPAALDGPVFCSSASTAYCEQVGVNRHEGGVKGEMQSW